MIDKINISNTLTDNTKQESISKNNYTFFNNKLSTLNTNLQLYNSSTNNIKLNGQHLEVSYIKGTSGLYNLGNTCYINSILQCLLHLSEFRNYIIDNLYKDDMIENIKEQINNSSNPSLKNNLEILSKLVNTKIVYQIDRIFSSLWQNFQCNYKTITLCKLLAYKNQKYRFNQQHDSHEFLLDIFDMIENEIKGQADININDYITENDLEKLNNYEELLKSEINDESLKIIDTLTGYINSKNLTFKNDNLIKKYKVIKYLENLYKSKYSIIDNLFTIGYIDTIECSICKFKSYNYLHSYWLTLDIPNHNTSDDSKLRQIIIDHLNKSDKISETSNEDVNSDDDNPEVSDNSSEDSDKNYELLNSDKCNLISECDEIINLKDCFDFTFKNEILDEDNKWLCHNCSIKTPCIKTQSIINLSNYLIIQIKRFTPYGTKINKKINLPEEINLQEYIDSACITTGYKFKLKSINNHIGTLNYGHYFSYVKLDNDKWYEFNDHHVKEIDNYDSDYCYLVIYEKID